MTDYIPDMIRGIFVGMGVAIGTAISEFFIRPYIQKLRERMKTKKIVEEEKKIIEQEIKKNDNP